MSLLLPKPLLYMSIGNEVDVHGGLAPGGTLGMPLVSIAGILIDASFFFFEVDGFPVALQIH